MDVHDQIQTPRKENCISLALDWVGLNVLIHFSDSWATFMEDFSAVKASFFRPRGHFCLRLSDEPLKLGKREFDFYLALAIKGVKENSEIAMIIQ